MQMLSLEQRKMVQVYMVKDSPQNLGMEIQQIQLLPYLYRDNKFAIKHSL